MTDSNGHKLLDKGWVQGAYLFCENLRSDFYQYFWASSKELQENLKSQLTDKRNAIILISQTCDIAAEYDKEKNLEFVIARKPKKKNYSPHPLNLDARSSRFLELQLSDGDWYKAEAIKTIQIGKEEFFNEVSSQNLPSQSLEEKIEVLARWRANRYMRIALPDNFNKKIKSLIDDGLFDNGLEDAGSIYLNLDCFDESENYTVRLFALHRKNSPPATYDALYEKINVILEQMNNIEGLTCPFVDGEEDERFQDILPIMRRNEVSIEQLDLFVRWNFDYVSLSLADSEGIDDDV